MTNEFKDLLQRTIREQGLQFGTSLLMEIADVMLEMLARPEIKEMDGRGQFLSLKSDETTVLIASGSLAGDLARLEGVMRNIGENQMSDVRVIEIDRSEDASS